MSAVTERSKLALVVSGGQSGVDRAALDAALQLGIPCGGWCPRGRRAEDGPIPDRYALRETEEDAYEVRTERNVCDSDATLILACSPLHGGTLLTADLARRHAKPCLVLDPQRELTPARALNWLIQHQVRVLNVAGPRETSHPSIYPEARRWLLSLFRACHATHRGHLS